MLCEVLRPFQATDTLLAIGAQVETDTWRPTAVASLIERRYLKPVEADSSTKLLPSKAKEANHG